MTKASDKDLGLLHGALARAMIQQLKSTDDAAALIDEYHDELPGDVLAFLEKQSSANPALLSAITKFLKDNNITCSIEDSDEMSELAQRLANKPVRKVGNVVPFAD